MEYGTQVATAAPASCLELQLHSVLWETGCWHSACHRCFLSTTKLRTCIHEVRMPPLCFNAYATRIQGSGTLCREQRRWTINKTTRLCIYTSVSWRSAYLRCLLSTITEPRLCTCTHSCASAAAVPTRVASRRLPAVDVYLHAYSGELAQRLPALPPLDNPPQLCTFTHTRTRLLNPTNAASCRHRSWTRTGTNIRASWHSSYWRCIASSSGPGQVYAHMLGQAGTVPTGVASC